jgi:hypothetical protein
MLKQARNGALLRHIVTPWTLCAITPAIPLKGLSPFLRGLCLISLSWPSGLLGRIDFRNPPSVCAGASASGVADFGLYAVHINA